MVFEHIQRGDGRYGGRPYDAVDDKLKWGYHQGARFEFIRGQIFKVSRVNPARRHHEGAVGIYLGCRGTESGHMAILKCLGKEFYADADTLVPWEGEITEEHLKLISARKKTHLLIDNHCACKCDSNPCVKRPALSMEEFLKVLESHRCSNCNGIAKTLARQGNQGIVP
jgi:hypothetical protein